MSYNSPIRGNRTAQRGQDLSSDGFAVLDRSVDNSTEQRSLCLMFEDEFTHLVDGVNTVQVTIALRHPPREKTVATEDQALCPRVVFHRLLNQKRQLEAWTLPGYPHNVAVELLVELFQLFLAIGAGS